MSEFSVDVRGVSKQFRLAHGKPSSLKERVVNRGRGVQYEDFWALRDMVLEVKEGESVGILGRNGSGKSTLSQMHLRGPPAHVGRSGRPGQVGRHA